MATVIVSEPSTDAIAEAGLFTWTAYGIFATLDIELTRVPSIDEIRSIGRPLFDPDADPINHDTDDFSEAAHILRCGEDAFMVISSTWETLGLFVLPVV